MGRAVVDLVFIDTHQRKPLPPPEHPAGDFFRRVEADKGGFRQGGGELHGQRKQVVGVRAVTVQKHQKVSHRPRLGDERAGRRVDPVNLKAMDDVVVRRRLHALLPFVRSRSFWNG